MKQGCSSGLYGVEGPLSRQQPWCGEPQESRPPRTPSPGLSAALSANLGGCRSDWIACRASPSIWPRAVVAARGACVLGQGGKMIKTPRDNHAGLGLMLFRFSFLQFDVSAGIWHRGPTNVLSDSQAANWTSPVWQPFLAAYSFLSSGGDADRSNSV